MFSDVEGCLTDHKLREYTKGSKDRKNKVGFNFHVNVILNIDLWLCVHSNSIPYYIFALWDYQVVPEVIYVMYNILIPIAPVRTAVT